MLKINFERTNKMKRKILRAVSALLILLLGFMMLTACKKNTEGDLKGEWKSLGIKAKQEGSEDEYVISATVSMGLTFKKDNLVKFIDDENMTIKTYSKTANWKYKISKGKITMGESLEKGTKMEFEYWFEDENTLVFDNEYIKVKFERQTTAETTAKASPEPTAEATAE